MNAKKLVRDSIKHIELNHPGLIRFVPDESVLKSLELHVRVKKMTTPLYMYGINFLLAFMEYCIKIEEYEVCNAILKAVNEHNELVKDKLPTKLKTL